jgi:hypothetical protein
LHRYVAVERKLDIGGGQFGAVVKFHPIAELEREDLVAFIGPALRRCRLDMARLVEARQSFEDVHSGNFADRGRGARIGRHDQGD